VKTELSEKPNIFDSDTESVTDRPSLIEATYDLPGKPGSKLKVIADSDQKTIMPYCQTLMLDTNDAYLR
jgi:hypothetical protein